MMIVGIDVGCVVESLRGGEIPDKDCLLPLLSKVLGYCIVAASTTVKLPQLSDPVSHNLPAIVQVSTLAFELEVVGYSIALAYCLHKQLPFSAFGEMIFLLIQASLILVAIIYYFSQPSVGTFTWIRALIYCAVAPTVLAGNISPVLFEALYASEHAVFFCARAPQIWQNFKNKSTGELSLLTSLMNFGGSMVRVFTSLQEKAPTNVVMGSVIGIFTNGTILTQILVYGNPRENEDQKKKN